MVESCVYGHVVVFLWIVGRAAAKDWLCHKLIFIEYVAKHLYKLQPIGFGHTVVYDEQLVHLGLTSFYFKNAVLYLLDNFSALDRAVALKAELIGLSSHHDHVYRLVVDNQRIVVVLADFCLLEINIKK